MKKNNLVLRGLVVLTLNAITGGHLLPAVAADYPPSIQVLEIGKPLTKPVPVTIAGTTAVVPVAKSTDIPIVNGEPVTPAKANLAQKLLTNTSVQSTPIQLTDNLVLGGIGADELAPLATISSSKKSEVQIPVDVPTRVAVTGYKAGSTGRVTFIDARGKSKDLGQIKASSTGRVMIPALTFEKNYLKYTVKIVIGGKSTSFTIRSTN